MPPEDAANAWNWWNWWVQFATAVGTVGTVMAALFIEFFRDWIRYRFLPPKVRIELREGGSKEVPAFITRPDVVSVGMPPHETKSRWYHVTVTNSRKWVQATGVRVYLLRVEEPNEADEFITTWDDPIPLNWRHGSLEDPTLTRTVGHPVVADLVAFYRDAPTEKEPFLWIQTSYFPNLFDPHRVGRRKLRLVLVARERQVGSEPITIEISWDGKWPEKHEKMPTGLVVREVAPSVRPRMRG